MEQIFQTRKWHQDSRWASQEFRTKHLPSPLNEVHWRHFYPPSDRRPVACPRLFVCVDVSDEHRNSMCSRTSCDCNQLTGVQLQRNQLNSACNVTTQHITMQSSLFPPLAVLNTATTPFLKFLLTRRSLRSTEKSLRLNWRYCATQQQWLNRLSDFHRILYEVF
jgi:hypothetical protein